MGTEDILFWKNMVIYSNKVCFLILGNSRQNKAQCLEMLKNWVDCTPALLWNFIKSQDLATWRSLPFLKFYPDDFFMITLLKFYFIFKLTPRNSSTISLAYPWNFHVLNPFPLSDPCIFSGITECIASTWHVKQKKYITAKS